jgi:hypothetical protein
MSKAKKHSSSKMDKISDDTISEYIDHIERSIEYYLTLTEEERDLISDYKGMYYNNLNSALMGEPIYGSITSITSSPLIKKIPENIEKMNKIVINSPKIQRDIYVYRGQTQLIKPVFYDTEYGDFLVKNDGFLSTSVFKDISLNFTGNTCCIYRIKIPKGTPMLVVLDSYDTNISTAEELENLVADTEVEMILPPGCKFIMHKEITYTPKDIYAKKLIKNKDLKDKKELFEENYKKPKKTVEAPIETKDLELVEYQTTETKPDVDYIKQFMKVSVNYKDIREKLESLKTQQKTPSNCVIM